MLASEFFSSGNCLPKSLKIQYSKVNRRNRKHMPEPDLNIKEVCLAKGADLVGIADLGLLKGRLPTVPESLLEPYHFAVSIAVRLDDSIIDEIRQGPTPAYARHCRNINVELERITSEIAGWIFGKGFSALPVPASRQEDTENLLGAISHKAVARMAGIGWQGKSLLIVTRDFGPRIRFATVLTDMPLTPDAPVENRCGECTECTDACPASAIRNATTEDYYRARQDAIDLQRCYKKLLEFKEQPGIGYTFCGVCIKVCPWGKT